MHTYEELKKSHGKKAILEIDGKKIEGIISVNDNFIFLANDEISGVRVSNRFGKKYLLYLGSYGKIDDKVEIKLVEKNKKEKLPYYMTL